MPKHVINTDVICTKSKAVNQDYLPRFVHY